MWRAKRQGLRARLLSAYCISLLLGGTLSAQETIPKLPVSAPGCHIELIREPEGVRRWHVTVWGDGGQSRHLFSIRGDSERMKAFRDCNDWLRDLAGKQKPKKEKRGP